MHTYTTKDSPYEINTVFDDTVVVITKATQAHYIFVNADADLINEALQNETDEWELIEMITDLIDTKEGK
tara:strand:+ start:1051 stop:1260 length:210 start_codon:yes stop_codon:yes gene_type:complete